MRAIFYLIFTLVLVLSTQGRAGTKEEVQKKAFQSIQSTLKKPTLLRANFTQNRILRVLKKPLFSSGKMIYFSNKGVAWLVEKPRPLKLYMTPGGMLKNLSEKNASTQFNPITQMISSILFSTLSGNFETLRAQFNIVKISHKTNPRGEWFMLLQVKDTELRKFISSIQLRGNAFIKSIKLLEAPGDSLTISFFNLRTQPSSLYEEEKVYFVN